MKKISFYLLLLSFMSLQAAVYQGRTAYIGFCKDCHGNGTKMSKAYTGDQWRGYLEKKGKVLAAVHVNSSKMAARIAQQQTKGLLPYSSVESIKEYFLNKSEIVVKSMSRSEKKAAKRRIFKYQSRHLKDFFVEFASDSGKVPACSDDAGGGESSEQIAQAKRIQEAERNRRAKKAEREKAKYTTSQVAANNKKAILANKKAKEKAAERERAKERKLERAKLEKAKAKKDKAQAVKIAKAKALKLKKAKKAKALRAANAKKQRITKAQLANHKRKTKLSINEQIVDLVSGKLSEKDLNKLKILLLSK